MKKKILKRDGVFGLIDIEFYKVDGELVAWWWEYDGEEEYCDPPWESNYYECGCCKCCGCMCWMEGEDEDE